MDRPRIPKPLARLLPQTIRPSSRSGERERLSPLDLDLQEFLEEEPITKRVNYVENLAQLRAIIAGCSVVRPSGFDRREFAEGLVGVDMYTHEKGEENGYYLAQDRLGSQYRIYINPEGKIDAPNLDYDKRVVLMHGERTCYIFPVSFPER